MALQLLALSLAAAIPKAGSAHLRPNLAQSILLNDAVHTHGARCLDGSPQRIWLQRSQSASAANRSKWYFHFMGGGWCRSEPECIQRAYDPKQCYRGSSSLDCFNANDDLEPGKTFNETMDFRNVPCINGARWGGGLLMNTPETNPLTHDWNKVEIVYCDGGSYAGNQGEVSRVSYGGRDDLPLYYRGQRNLDATIDYLVKHEGLGDATHFLVSGDSAGGLATIWHADYFRTLLPKASVLAVPDSGFFYGDASKPAWPAALRWMAETMNFTAGLDRSCVEAATKAGVSPATACTLPEDVMPFVEVPTFVLNSRFDPALRSFADNSPSFAEVGDHLLSKVKSSALRSQRNAAFITACSEHCGQWAQGQILPGHNDFNVTIDGWTAASAVDAWAGSLWSGSPFPRQLWLQNASYPCKTCCSGGDALIVV
mmetsp:Transcript_148035/g.260947  ORF Transcript_148035/g.260947 Transcript_148035/m.260947 type:complete len:427 (-) Transcript_148035:60-1340(-)